MPVFKISVVNEHYSSTNEHECADAKAARKHAITGALAIATDQVANGDPFFAAEVKVEDGGGAVARYVVSVGASPLKA